MDEFFDFVARHWNSLGKQFAVHGAVWFSYFFLSLLSTGAGIVLGAIVFGRDYKRRIAALEARPQVQPVSVDVNMPQGDAVSEPVPQRASFQREFQIAFWTDPKDGQRKQVWIPVIWLEYENGARKPMEIEGLLDKQGMTKFLGPISFREDDSPPDL